MCFFFFFFCDLRQSRHTWRVSRPSKHRSTVVKITTQPPVVLASFPNGRHFFATVPENERSSQNSTPEKTFLGESVIVCGDCLATKIHQKTEQQARIDVDAGSRTMRAHFPSSRRFRALFSFVRSTAFDSHGWRREITRDVDQGDVRDDGLARAAKPGWGGGGRPQLFFMYLFFSLLFPTFLDNSCLRPIFPS